MVHSHSEHMIVTARRHIATFDSMTVGYRQLISMYFLGLQLASTEQGSSRTGSRFRMVDTGVGYRTRRNSTRTKMDLSQRHPER